MNILLNKEVLFRIDKQNEFVAANKKVYYSSLAQTLLWKNKDGRRIKLYYAFELDDAESAFVINEIFEKQANPAHKFSRNFKLFRLKVSKFFYFDEEIK
jgi:hypothetical protein